MKRTAIFLLGLLLPGLALSNSGQMVLPRFGSPYFFKPFAANKVAEISYSRAFFETRFLLGVDPISNLPDPQFDSDVYSCLNQQVESLLNFLSTHNGTRPRKVHISLMEIAGDLAASSCRPEMVAMSDNSVIFQVCYARSYLNTKSTCRVLASKDLTSYFQSLTADAAKREKALTSLKDSSEKLIEALSK